MRKFRFFALACAVLLGGRPGFASNAGVSAMPVLKLDRGPRAIAMGGAYTALSADVYAMRYNPAGLARVKSTELSGMFHKGVLDTNMQEVGAAVKLPFIGLSGTNAPVLGASLFISRNGDIDWYKTNRDGSAAFSGASRSAGGDVVASLAYAEKFDGGELGHGLNAYEIEHYLGLNAKLLYSTLPNRDGTDVNAQTLAFDAGYITRMPDLHTSLGVSLLNAGGGVQYIEAKSPLPLTLRVGAAFEHEAAGKPFTASLDYLSYMKEEANRLRAGLEYALDRRAIFRLGYKFMEDTEGGLTAGFGTSWKQVSFDFGFALDNTIESVYEMGLTYRFAAPEEPKSSRGRSRARQPQQQQQQKPSGDYMLLY